MAEWPETEQAWKAQFSRDHAEIARLNARIWELEQAAAAAPSSQDAAPAPEVIDMGWSSHGMMTVEPQPAAAPPGDLVGADELDDRLDNVNDPYVQGYITGLRVEPDRLRGALRECRDWMGDGENQPAQHHPGCEWLLSLVGGTCDCGHDRIVARADAALASAEREEDVSERDDGCTCAYTTWDESFHELHQRGCPATLPPWERPGASAERPGGESDG